MIYWNQLIQLTHSWVKKRISLIIKKKMLRSAVEREFEIIGEALNQLNKIDQNLPVSNKSLIVGMRNRVIHGYDKVDDEIVWGAIL